MEQKQRTGRWWWGIGSLSAALGMCLRKFKYAKLIGWGRGRGREFPISVYEFLITCKHLAQQVL